MNTPGRISLRKKMLTMLFVLICTFNLNAINVNVSNVKELVNAVTNGSPGDIINLSSGTYVLTSQLVLKSGMTIRGAGINLTIVMADTAWNPGKTGLPPRNETDPKTVKQDAYLFKIENISDVTFSNMTLTAPLLHGAIFANKINGLVLFNLMLKNFIWSGVYTFYVKGFKVHDCIFEDAGGTVKWQGAAIYNNRTNVAEFYNCHIYMAPSDSKKRTQATGGGYVGFKGYGNKNSHIHHNTVEVDFSLEYMFEKDENNEIDHNMFVGTLSIPKEGGDDYPGGYSFWIHHNWFRNSYTIELPRNGVIVDHNLFDFAADQDGGRLFSCFFGGATRGPVDCHDNLIKNPGRGLFWSKGNYNQLKFYNNHVIANTTITPRTDGLFSFTKTSDFSTIDIKDNIIECIGTARPLFQNTESCASVIENNTLTNVTDTKSYSNPDTGKPRGVRGKLNFTCGYKNEFLIDNWKGGLAP